MRYVVYILEGTAYTSSSNGATAVQFNVKQEAILCAREMSRNVDFFGGTVSLGTTFLDCQNGQRINYENGAAI